MTTSIADVAIVSTSTLVIFRRVLDAGRFEPRSSDQLSRSVWRVGLVHRVSAVPSKRGKRDHGRARQTSISAGNFAPDQTWLPWAEPISRPARSIRTVVGRTCTS